MPAATAGSLPPTLTLRNVSGGSVAVQSGIPVPTFDAQPRETLSLSGTWRVERTTFDSDLTLTDRASSMAAILAAAAGRQLPGYADADWASVAVPGSVNPPPDSGPASAWYRLHFELPASWQGRALTLKFGAANYVADVWLNGKYLGYHEGGFTPFAFDVSAAAQPGQTNILAVRVDDPTWGTRDDIVPWGLADWWNYGGLTQPVWMEATPALLVDRADVVPHLDGADVSVTVEDRAIPGVSPSAVARGNVLVEVLPAVVDQANLLDPDAASLIPPDATPLATKEFSGVGLSPGGVAVLDASFSMSHPGLWSIGEPNLYVLRVSFLGPAGTADRLVTTFGLRHVAVDPQAPRVLLNGDPTFFTGASVHAEQIGAGPAGTAAEPLTTARQAYGQVQQAMRVNATLLRTAHQPAVPALLTVADRLGIAIWEEIPLYHFTPRTFDLTLQRGIPQQMLQEMALRDMNRPAVLFYGLANESTGDGERAQAMATLAGVAKAIDGTRLTGQASYGFDASAATSDALDVVGFTAYYGVFYGTDPARGTVQALTEAHGRYPSKPLMVLEFGYWADPPGGEAHQTWILGQTEPAIEARSDVHPGGYVAASVWWSLDDYYTMRPGIEVERFGMFDPHGTPRPVAASAAKLFGAAMASAVAATRVPAGDRAVPAADRAAPQVVRVMEGGGATLRLGEYLAYAVAVSVLILAGLLGLSLTLHRRWPAPGRRSLLHGGGPR